MSCHSCGIIPQFLIVHIRDHVAANPEFYEELSTDPVPGVKESPYDRKEYLEYWSTSIPEGFEVTTPAKDLEIENRRTTEITAESFRDRAVSAAAGAGMQTDNIGCEGDSSTSEGFEVTAPAKEFEIEDRRIIEITTESFRDRAVESKPLQYEASEGKKEQDEDEQERSMGASFYGAAAAAAGAGRQTDNIGCEGDSSTLYDLPGALEPEVRELQVSSVKNDDPVKKSEDLIEKLQPPSWYTDVDVATQRGASFTFALGGTAAAVGAFVASGGAAGVATGIVADAVGGTVASISAAAAASATEAATVTMIGGSALALGAAIAKAKAKAARTARNLNQLYLAKEDFSTYFSEKHWQQIFISDANTRAIRMNDEGKTDTDSSVECESPFPRTIAGIQAKSNDYVAERAYQAIERTLAFLAQRFDRDSIDGDGQMIIASIHYPRKVVVAPGINTDWSDAVWETNKQQILIGDGDPGGKVFNPFSLDLTTIAHEVIHGMTQHTVGLRYRNQSGALDEHISDVFAILVKNNDLWERPSSGITDDRVWYIGKDLYKEEYKRKIPVSFPGEFVHALRSMKNPGTAFSFGVASGDRQVSKMSDYDHTTDDHGGVHINSGIPNKAFYLFATNIGEKALKTAGKVWYATITSGRLQRNAQFIDFANETIRHVEPTNLPALQKAWRDVGIAV